MIKNIMITSDCKYNNIKRIDEPIPNIMSSYNNRFTNIFSNTVKNGNCKNFNAKNSAANSRNIQNIELVVIRYQFLFIIKIAVGSLRRQPKFCASDNQVSILIHFKNRCRVSKNVINIIIFHNRATFNMGVTEPSFVFRLSQMLRN